MGDMTRCRANVRHFRINLDTTGATPMAHTLAAVFDDREDAEGAREKLINAGFDRSCIRLNDSNSRYADASAVGTTGSSSDSSTTSMRSDDDDDRSFMDSVREFFGGLF